MTETKASFAALLASCEETRARAHELRANSIVILQRLAATRQEFEEVSVHTQALLTAVRGQYTSRHLKKVGQTASDPINAMLKAFVVLGRDESDLEDMTDDLIAAYQAAVVTGDDDMRLLLAGALKQIGRYLAMKVGPKAAGVIMN